MCDQCRRHLLRMYDDSIKWVPNRFTNSFRNLYSAFPRDQLDGAPDSGSIEKKQALQQLQKASQSFQELSLKLMTSHRLIYECCVKPEGLSRDGIRSKHLRRNREFKGQILIQGQIQGHNQIVG